MAPGLSGSEVPDWLAAPALAPFWSRLRVRLESQGLEPSGRLDVGASSRDERHALGAVLGRPVIRERVSVDLVALDRRMADRSGLGGLVDVVAAVTGSPLRDRPRERDEARSRREEPLSLARSLVVGPWVEAWVAGLRRTGLLTNRHDAAGVVSEAAVLLKALLDGDRTVWSRVSLGAQLLGDAHALDEDRLLHQVVLRALAAASGGQVPAMAADRRALWARYGVMPDLVSATCLTIGLRPTGSDALSRRLRLAAEAGDPVHLTAWDLRPPVVEVVQTTHPPFILVCENPRVLEAAAERFAGALPVVCTSGEPTTVVSAVLDLLVAGGCRLRYHGDFDWPGVAIANRVIARHGAVPWLMSAGDYEGGLALVAGAPPLAGAPVEPSWDAELGAAMRLHGQVVHEETVIDVLFDSLAGAQ